MENKKTLSTYVLHEAIYLIKKQKSIFRKEFLNIILEYISRRSF